MSADQAEDAVMLNTSDMTIDEVVNTIGYGCWEFRAISNGGHI